MKASFDAFLMVLHAGVSNGVFNESNHQSIQEDFDGLKKLFCSFGEELIVENVVEKEAEHSHHAPAKTPTQPGHSFSCWSEHREAFSQFNPSS
ncbi:hypothetical protein VNO78_06942 [Psophocarpus tetragonolobus]|uniref:PATROL1-like C-terminal domain-containing protein n=1 Tax=Psophocarpus tetragonolobus TaxID=3891 RepID=A0AAN9SUS2_PSOTE